MPELEGAPTFSDLCAAEDLSEESVKAGEMLDKVHTPLETVYIGCPKQALVLARSGDHEDYENIFF